MSLSQAETFIATAKSLGIRADLYRDYSGRGMFGERTTAVVLKSDRAVRHIRRQAGIVETVRTDSLGLDVIAY